jgi:RNA-binding protein
MKGKRGRELRAQGQAVEATLFVGAGGVTGAVAAEAAQQLKTRALLKAKVAREAADAAGMKAVGEALAAQAGADLVEVRGRTVLLAKRGRLKQSAQGARK